MPELKQALSILSAPGNRDLLTTIRRGIEKESLRVTAEGALAATPHPKALGSALTHPRITTDFSEALIELITPPASDAHSTLTTLDEIHRYTYQHIGEELLWVSSMPCSLGADEEIPIAHYGHSNVGRMKEVYRIGLGHRYGRLMQTIAGIHYNWSLPDECLNLLQAVSGDKSSFQQYRTTSYLGLIRNFRRLTWLLLYLFGAAPATCKSFVKARSHQLVPLGEDNHTLHTPFATSLRMGDLGYQSTAQESLYVCYNDLDAYIHSLEGALSKPYPAYEALGEKDAEGNYLQLNTHLLQIENEFYSTVRPKRTTRRGETPIKALRERGIEYVEVRCIDLNPFLPLGIDKQQTDFIDIFLLYCLLAESSQIDEQSYAEIIDNQKRTVYEGRHPQFQLSRNGETVSLRAWGEELMAAMSPIAETFDAAHGGSSYRESLQNARQRLQRPELTPSAQVLECLQSEGLSYFQWALKQSRAHREDFMRRPLELQTETFYREMSHQSLAEQAAIEAADTKSFEAYLADYFSQYRQ